VQRKEEREEEVLLSGNSPYKFDPNSQDGLTHPRITAWTRKADPSTMQK
jgi:hypothetical protein